MPARRGHSPEYPNNQRATMISHSRLCRLAALNSVLALLVLLLANAPAQEKSVNPGINKNFEKPDVKKYVKTFEGESREIFADRKKIVEACRLKPGMAVADIGAGTGLFSRLFAREVGPTGKVYAVDIAKEFLEHIGKTSKDEGLNNVVGVLCTQLSAELPPGSVDLVFICDTYHHFEFPYRTMTSIHRALKPGGELVLIDFKRIKGVSSDFIMNHVRAGQEVFTQEVIESGFKLVEELKFLKENYLLRFKKVERKPR
jgi:ubiquinone/menaquinone biosynthesis C-methylase UbiE